MAWDDEAFFRLIGYQTDERTRGPVIDFDDDEGTYFKFMSDEGQTDDEQGDVFANWLMDPSREFRHSRWRHRSLLVTDDRFLPS